MTFGSVFGRTFSPTFQPSSQAAASSAAFVPTDISNCLIWIDFADNDYLFTDAGSTKVANDGDLIYQANDKSGNSNNITQATQVYRAAYKTGIQNSKSIARFDGINDYYAMSLTANAGSFTFVFAYNNNETFNNSADASGYLLDSQTGRFVIASSSGNDPFNEIGWYDGSWHEIANATNGWQTNQFNLPNGGNGTVYRNGSSLGTAAYTAKAIGGTTTLSGRYNAGGNFLTGDIGEFIIYAKALDASETAALETYLNNKWAIY